MSVRLRLIFAVLMPLALFFGFLHLFLPGNGYNFERLHVFLFNLCSGGTIILYYTENLRRLSLKTGIFLILAIIFAITAFFKLYVVAIVIALVLSVLVESIRIKAFTVIPIGFFLRGEPIYRKFHQASLLCLSIGLALSALVMINNEFIRLIEVPRLNLDIFFLGFSFPVSLITMSIIFSLINDERSKSVRSMKEIGFWAVNLGVIIFFCFIIFDRLHAQVVVTLLLFAAVIMILLLFYYFSKRMQQKNFLISGLFFLLASAITGIAYVVLEIYHPPDNLIMVRVLRLHAFFSLYGWNLCGLAVICRFNDFPIQLHSRYIILVHWITILIAGTVGDSNPSLALLSVVGYVAILYMIFFSRGANIILKAAAANN
jgi:hypothetical protein